MDKIEIKSLIDQTITNYFNEKDRRENERTESERIAKEREKLKTSIQIYFVLIIISVFIFVAYKMLSQWI